MTDPATSALDLVFLGTPEYAAVSLRRLLETGHRVRAVVTRPDRPRGRGQRLEPCATKKLALEAGLEVLDPRSARDEAFLDRLRELRVDLGVVVAYGRILPKEALEAPRLGCINAHASLLPSLRGAAPIERAILAGLQRTGVTIMQMNEGLDEGDVLFERAVEVPDSMNGAELRERLAGLSADMLVEAVDAFARGGGISPTPQDHAAATFAPPLRKEEAALLWGGEARDLWLRVRAFAPRPGAFAFDQGRRLKVLDARVDDHLELPPGTVRGTDDGRVAVACGRGSLQVLVVQPEGRRSMPAADWLRGRRGKGGSILLDDGR